MQAGPDSFNWTAIFSAVSGLIFGFFGSWIAVTGRIGSVEAKMGSLEAKLAAEHEENIRIRNRLDYFIDGEAKKAPESHRAP